MGTAATVYWLPSYSFPRWLLWALLVPALYVKENRSRQAWTILVPLLGIHALMLLASHLLSSGSSGAWLAMGMLSHVVDSFALSQALLWLLAHKLASDRLIKSFFAATMVMAVVGSLSSLARPGSGIAREATPHAVVYGTASLSFLLGLTIAGAFCRKRYTQRRFTRRFLLWTTVVCAACMAVIAPLMGAGGADVATSVLLGGPIYGVLIYLLALPFMILVFRVPLYRARLMAWLQLEPERDGQTGDGGAVRG